MRDPDAARPLTRPADPLLAAAEVLIVLFRILSVTVIVAAGIAIGAIVSVGRAGMLARIAAVGAPDSALWALTLFLALIIVLMMLAYRFFSELGGIVGTVADGEPFRHDNAERLAHMGWLAVGAQALGLALAALADWFGPYLEKAGRDSDLGFGPDIGGILLAVILFILARVFREGTRMREDLEGTV
jgi:hypothetical protein